VPLFILGFDADGSAVAGVRFHGPLEGSHQAAIIEEIRRRRKSASFTI